MLATRFECKYFIPARIVPTFRDYIRPFVRPDKYAEFCPDHTYDICSLYLDSWDLRLFNEGLRGEKNRYKLRIRTYADGPAEPVFFEIKKRMNGMVYKRRSVLDRPEARQVVDNISGQAIGLPCSELGLAAEFTHLSREKQVVPLMRVKYRREAYDAIGPEPVRITFDTELRAAASQNGELSLVDGPWVDVPLDGVILEIKFTERFPSWVGDLISVFELQKQSISKYVNCLAERMERGLHPELLAYLE